MATPDDYRHWTRETLVTALIQAEGDIKELQEENAYLRDEADRYHKEARDDAKVIGGILRVLRDSDLIPGWRERVPL